jgi:conserved surface-anchored protein, band 7 family
MHRGGKIMEWIYIIIVAVVIILILFGVSYVKAPPDTAYIITGPKKQRVLIGRAGIRIPGLERVDKIPLSLIQVDIKTASAVPTQEFINIFVDGVANIKIDSEPEALAKASQIFLSQDLDGIRSIAKEVLEGNMREIIGQMRLEDLVHNRDLFAEKVKENAMQDMGRMGLQIINLTIQNFIDDNKVIENLGVDNIAQISKNASIARAQAERDVSIAQSEANETANKARIESETLIVEQNTRLALRQAELKQQSDTAKATADAAYSIEEQKRQQEINVAKVNADIAKREREVELGQREVELQERQLEANIKKTAEAKKYATEQEAEADLFQRQKAAEAARYEEEQRAHALRMQSEATRYAAEQEAAGILAKGNAEAEAIEKKAEAMKKMGEASVLELILDSGVLPEIVKAYSEPLAKAYSQIDSITMYGEGNTAKLAEEVTTNGSQLFQSLEQTLGIDLKSIIAGYLGGKLASKKNENEEIKQEVETTPKQDEEKPKE